MHFASSVVALVLAASNAAAQATGSITAGGSGSLSGSASGSLAGASGSVSGSASGSLSGSASSASGAPMSSAASSAPMAASTDSSGMVNVQVVQVSNTEGKLTFTPNSLTAAVGSMVQFQFHPMNHSVVQSTFANPCVPINNIMPNVNGLFSGFMPVAKGSTQMPVFTVPINNTTPVWFYCAQGKHCQAGMVGVINPPADTTKTQATYAALAAQAPMNLAPGQSMMTSSTNSSGSTGSTGTTSTSSNSTTSSGPPLSTGAASNSKFAGAFAGVAVAAFVAAFMTVAC